MPTEDIVFVDFGMNIGAAALYFSQFENVKKVYGYEPFPDTFKQADHNISINDVAIKRKFEIYDVAVTDHAGEDDIPVYSEHTRERSISDFYNTQTDKEILRSVHIRSMEAKEILSGIFENEKGKKVVLKIDVEGSEYDILKNIQNTEIFDKVDRLILEYHRGILPLLKEIDARGFKYKISGNDMQGFIFASKGD